MRRLHRNKRAETSCRHLGVSKCRSARIFALALLAIAASGCRQNPRLQVYIDNVNAEKRVLEDKLYDLQDDYQAKVEEIEKLRKEIKRLRKNNGTTTDEDAAPAPFPLFPRPKKTKAPDIEGLAPPVVEPGEPAAPSTTKKKKAGSKKENNDNLDKLLQPPSLDIGHEMSSASNAGKRQTPKDRVVAKLVVQPAPAASGSAATKQFSLLLRPQNKDGQLVPVAGRVSIVLLDSVARARVARWDLDQEKVAQAISQAGSKRGFVLHLPWPDTPPTHNHLHLFVRFWPEQGKLIEVNREIATNMTSSIASRWTPRAPAPQHEAPKPGTVAEQADGTAPTKKSDSATADAQADTPQLSKSSEPIKQAARPQWRPYR